MSVDLAELRRLAEQAREAETATDPEDDPQAFMLALSFRDEATDALVAACDPGTVLALVEAVEAAKALYERVEMDESVGVCLSSRVESLNAAAALAPFVEAR